MPPNVDSAPRLFLDLSYDCPHFSARCVRRPNSYRRYTAIIDILPCQRRQGIPTVLRMSFLARSRFGGFLLHRGWFRPSLTTQARAVLSTGCNAVPPRQDIHCADHIGVVLVTTTYTLEMCLRLPILCCHPPAGRTGPARVLWWHGYQHSAIPAQLVLQLATELEPTLIQNGFVQTGLGSNMLARFLSVAFARSGHILHLQVLYTHHRVVFADRGRGLVQEVAPSIANSDVDVPHSPFGFLPVLAEFCFAAQRPLIAAQSRLMLLEAVERSHKAAIPQRSEAHNPHVDSHRAGGARYGLFNLALGLNAGIPLACGLADGDVLGRPQNVPAVAVSNPAQLGQPDTAVGLVYLELLGIGVTKTLAPAFALEAGEHGSFGKEVFVRSLQIFERMLQWVYRGLIEPRCFGVIAPLCQLLCHRYIADKLTACLVVGLLQRQRLVEHEAARPGEAAHGTLLSTIGHEYKFEGL